MKTIYLILILPMCIMVYQRNNILPIFSFVVLTMYTKVYHSFR